MFPMKVPEVRALIAAILVAANGIDVYLALNPGAAEPAVGRQGTGQVHVLSLLGAGGAAGVGKLMRVVSDLEEMNRTAQAPNLY